MIQQWLGLLSNTLVSGMFGQLKPVIENPSIMILIFIALNGFLLMATLIIYPTLLLLMVVTWVSKLTQLSQLNQLATSHEPRHSVTQARRCLTLYTEVEKGMGAYFFVYLSLCQFLLVTQGFLSISTVMGGLSGTLAICTFLQSFGQCFAFWLQTAALTFCLDDCFRSLKTLAKDVRRDILDMEEGRDKELARNLVQVHLFGIFVFLTS